MVVSFRTLFLFAMGCVFLWAVSLCGAEENETVLQQTGFRLSETALLNLHLSLASEYDTNINRVSEKSTFVDNNDASRNYAFSETGDLIVHFSPALRAKIDDKEKTLGMALALSYDLYSGLEDKKTFEHYSTLSSLHFDTNVLGEFNKDGNVIVQASNNLRRDNRPDQIAIENGLHTNLFEDFLLSLYVKNTEDTLSLKISSGVQLNYFEESLLSRHNFWNSRNSLYGQWKFLPKTGAFFNVSFTYQDYFNAGAYRDDERAMPLSVFVGALGQLTSKISLKLSGGYTNSLSKEMRHDGVAGVEFIFRNSQNTMLRLGYVRSLMPVPVFQYYVLDKAYLEVVQKFFNRLLLKLDASYSHYDYGDNVRYPALNMVETTTDATTGAVKTTTTTQQSVSREDHVIRVQPTISYNFLRWLGLALQYTFEMRQTPYYSSQQVVVTGVAAPTNVTYTTHYDYMDHRVLLTLTADY